MERIRQQQAHGLGRVLVGAEEVAHVNQRAEVRVFTPFTSCSTRALSWQKNPWFSTMVLMPRVAANSVTARQPWVSAGSASPKPLAPLCPAGKPPVASWRMLGEPRDAPRALHP